MVLKVWACGPFPRALFQKHGRIDAAIYTKNFPLLRTSLSSLKIEKSLNYLQLEFSEEPSMRLKHPTCGCKHMWKYNHDIQK